MEAAPAKVHQVKVSQDDELIPYTAKQSKEWVWKVRFAMNLSNNCHFPKITTITTSIIGSKTPKYDQVLGVVNSKRCSAASVIVAIAGLQPSTCPQGQGQSVRFLSIKNLM